MDTTSIIPGVIAGIITSVVIFCISKFIKKIAIPWYQSFVYDGYNVDGDWRITWTEPTLRRNITFNLKQSGPRVYGKSVHILKNPKLDGDYRKEYSLKGEIRNGYLCLLCKHTDRKRLGFSTVMLRIINDGQKMEGWIAAYNSGTSQVEGFKCKTEKIKDTP